MCCTNHGTDVGESRRQVGLLRCHGSDRSNVDAGRVMAGQSFSRAACARAARKPRCWPVPLPRTLKSCCVRDGASLPDPTLELGGCAPGAPADLRFPVLGLAGVAKALCNPAWPAPPKPSRVTIPVACPVPRRRRWVRWGAEPASRREAAGHWHTPSGEEPGRVVLRRGPRHPEPWPACALWVARHSRSVSRALAGGAASGAGAPHPPLFLAGQPEGPRHGQRLAKRQELLGARLGVASAAPVAPPLPPAIFVDLFWG